MRQLSSKVAALAVSVAALAFASVGMVSSAGAADPPPADAAVVAGKAEPLLHGPLTQTLGNPNGDVVIIEFFDYACPGCKAIEPKLQALLKADKNVKLVIKEFPILTAPSIVATKVAYAAAKQGKYGAFHQALMLRKGNLDEAAIFDTARAVGLDEARLRKDMASPAYADAIIANLNLARSLRVFATPTVFVNNRFVPGSSADMDFFRLAAEARAKG